MSLPHSLDPKAAEARELEGGVVLVGRASLKEYIEGLRQGWTGGVGEWDWEKDVERKLEADGVFDTPKPEFQPDEIDPIPESIPTPPPISPNTPVSALPSGLSFLSRPPPPQMTPSISNPASPSPPLISSHFHTPPSPLPPQPPILLLPFTNHLGFNQFPYMIYDFFTERYRVQSGADAGLALIEGHTRPFSEGDREWDRDGEKWYTKSFSQLLDRINTARKDYYSALEPRIESARTLASGARELSVAEKKSSKPPLTETDLRAERQKRELRWFGNEDGYEIVRKETEVAWDESFDGWLRVFELSESG